jgi:hypothetical protein
MHKLISVQCINPELNVVKTILNHLCHSYLYFQAKINLLANDSSKTSTTKPVLHFARRPALSITLKQHFRFIFYTDYSVSPFNIRASSPGLDYILIYVGQSYS